MIGIKDITDKIKKMFDATLRNPANTISGIVMICGLARRPGLSCLLSTGNIIQDISKKGIPTDDLPDGSPNLMNKLVMSVVCETFRALKEDANIQVAMAPGSINVTATGGNAGGPVVCNGPNINYATGRALLQ
jgi:hypothetical protein